jgi:hypothetical protein
MLQYLPKFVGRAMRGKRPGLERLAVNRPEVSNAPASIEVKSPAFGDGGTIPAKYSADGDGSSPPLEWHGVPSRASSLVLMVEDADSPTGEPLVHAIVPVLPRGDGTLPEGALPNNAVEGRPRVMGRNSFLKQAYAPPDPPPGHGPHRYAFEVFALDDAPALLRTPNRSAILDMMRGRVLAKGCLIGTYERA